MPTYDYRCNECDHEFEAFQKMSDEPLTECPECKGSVKRLIGAGAGFLFKGSGFYITDYRSSDYQAKAKKEKDSASGKSEGGKSGGKKKDSAAATSKPEKSGGDSKSASTS